MRHSWVHPTHALHYPITNKGYWPGNPLNQRLLGLILHVEVSGKSPGTPDEFFREGPPQNPDLVCPNVSIFQTPVNGFLIHQYLPFTVRPFCQVNGNQNYNAMETGGNPDERLNPDQVVACGRVMAIHHLYFGVPLAIADKPGEQGLGWHGMGGDAWGGHFDCPGNKRKAQRPDILAEARKFVERWSQS